MEDFKSALLEVVKYQNEQLLKLHKRLEEKLLVQNEQIEENQNKQQLKLQERIEERIKINNNYFKKEWKKSDLSFRN